MRLAIVLGLFGLLTAGAVGASVSGVGVPASYQEKINVREGSARRGHAGTLFFATRRTVGGGGFRGGK